MSTTTVHPTTTQPGPGAGSSKSSLRFWLGCAVGVVVSAPAAWLLSYGALLPFFLGVFFFTLLGLVIGAVTFRVAAKGRPYGRWTVLVGTTVIVAFCWTLSIIKESRDFPADTAVEAVRRVRDIGSRTGAQFRAEVAESVRTFLRERHPPGGTIGYIHWSLTSGELKKGDVADLDQGLKHSQGPLSWTVRVVLSIALLAFGIASQTFTLTAQPTSRDGTQPPL